MPKAPSDADLEKLLEIPTAAATAARPARADTTDADLEGLLKLTAPPAKQQPSDEDLSALLFGPKPPRRIGMLEQMGMMQTGGPGAVLAEPAVRFGAAAAGKGVSMMTGLLNLVVQARKFGVSPGLIFDPRTFVDKLEKMNILSESTAIDRIAEHAGNVVPFVASAGLAAGPLMAAGLSANMANTVALVGMTMVDQQEQANRLGVPLTPGEAAKGAVASLVFAGAGHIVGSLIGGWAEVLAKRTLSTPVKNAIKNTALGGLFEGGQAIHSKDPRWYEKAIAGALAFNIGNAWQAGFPGATKARTENEIQRQIEVAAKAVENGPKWRRDLIQDPNDPLLGQAHKAQATAWTLNGQVPWDPSMVKLEGEALPPLRAAGRHAVINARIERLQQFGITLQDAARIVGGRNRPRATPEEREAAAQELVRKFQIPIEDARNLANRRVTEDEAKQIFASRAEEAVIVEAAATGPDVLNEVLYRLDLLEPKARAMYEAQKKNFTPEEQAKIDEMLPDAKTAMKQLEESEAQLEPQPPERAYGEVQIQPSAESAAYQAETTSERLARLAERQQAPSKLVQTHLEMEARLAAERGQVTPAMREEAGGGGGEGAGKRTETAPAPGTRENPVLPEAVKSFEEETGTKVAEEAPPPKAETAPPPKTEAAAAKPPRPAGKPRSPNVPKPKTVLATERNGTAYRVSADGFGIEVRQAGGDRWEADTWSGKTLREKITNLAEYVARSSRVEGAPALKGFLEQIRYQEAERARVEDEKRAAAMAEEDRKAQLQLDAEGIVWKKRVKSIQRRVAKEGEAGQYETSGEPVSGETAGPFGVHRTRPGDKYNTSYTVTHLKSGFSAGNFPTQTEAKVAAYQLTKIGANWDFTDPMAVKNWSKEVTDKAAAIIRNPWIDLRPPEAQKAPVASDVKAPSAVTSEDMIKPALEPPGAEAGQPAPQTPAQIVQGEPPANEPAATPMTAKATENLVNALNAATAELRKARQAAVKRIPKAKDWEKGKPILQAVALTGAAYLAYKQEQDERAGMATYAAIPLLALLLRKPMIQSERWNVLEAQRDAKENWFKSKGKGVLEPIVDELIWKGKPGKKAIDQMVGEMAEVIKDLPDMKTSTASRVRTLANHVTHLDMIGAAAGHRLAQLGQAGAAANRLAQDMARRVMEQVLEWEDRAREIDTKGYDKDPDVPIAKDTKEWHGLQDFVNSFLIPGIKRPEWESLTPRAQLMAAEALYTFFGKQIGPDELRVAARNGRDFRDELFTDVEKLASENIFGFMPLKTANGRYRNQVFIDDVYYPPSWLKYVNPGEYQRRVLAADEWQMRIAKYEGLPVDFVRDVLAQQKSSFESLAFERGLDKQVVTKNAHLDFHRVLDTPIGRDWEMRRAQGWYLEGAYRRIEFARHFGSKGEIALQLRQWARAEGYNGWIFTHLFDAATQQSSNLTGFIGRGYGQYIHPIMREIESAIVLKSLGGFAIANLTQGGMVASHIGARNMVEATRLGIKAAIAQSRVLPESFKAKFGDELMREWVAKAGVTAQSVHADYLLSIQGVMPRLLAGYLRWGGGQLDRLNRDIAAIGGEIMFKKLFEEYKQARRRGNKAEEELAYKKLEEIFHQEPVHLEMVKQGEALAPEAVEVLRKVASSTIANRTQFRRLGIDMPALASDPLGRTFYSLSGFMIRASAEFYRQATVSLKNPAVRKRFLAGWLLATGLGTATVQLQRMRRHDEFDPEKDSWARELLEGAAYAGVGAGFYDAFQDITGKWGNPGKAAAGPIWGTLWDFGETIPQVRAKWERDGLNWHTADPTLRWLVKNSPYGPLPMVPGFPTPAETAKQLFPTKRGGGPPTAPRNRRQRPKPGS